jgi:cyanophycin synthetase
VNILDRQIINGANYWSSTIKKLIVLTVDLEEYEQLPSKNLITINESLIKLLPSLDKEFSSIDQEDLDPLRQKTGIGYVIEYVALELQNIAGMNCSFGRTYGSSKQGVYRIIFSYEIEKAGLYAGETAFNLVHSLVCGRVYNNLETNIKELKELFRKEQFGPSTEAMIIEAKKRKVPFTKIPNSSLIIFGQGCFQKKMWATVSSQTSSIAVEIASDKELTKKILSSSFIPVPQGTTIRTLEELETSLQSMQFPLVIKPFNGNHGRGVLTDINTQEKAILGFELAKKISERVLIEEFIPGNDYRFLVVNYKVVAVAKRTPAMIVGNGIHTIQQLIDITNEDPQRGLEHDNILTAIHVDRETNIILIENNLSLDSILPADQILYLKSTANLSSGGTATDVTDRVHPNNIKLAERVASLLNLDICGIDVVATNIQHPIQKNNGAIIEVNAGPGLRMHLQPSVGRARNVAASIMEMLYPSGSLATIPVIAVTGTNGKTTVVRLIAYLAQKAKYKVGFSTTEGIYSNGQLTYAGDCSGPLSTTSVLSDPSINFAVLECARGGILRSGLAFDECDISIITNISADHLGLKEIHSLEHLARVKSVVAHSTKKSGYCILNAEDELVYAMKKELTCSIALFALSKTERIQEHWNQKGFVCYLENDFVVIERGETKNYIAQLSRIPITFNSSASCMIKNILPAVLAAHLSHFPLKDIKDALYEFLPTAENLPGRMNLFHFDQTLLMIDYAHNEGAFIELKNYLNSIEKTRRIGIISAAGDRRIVDIQKIGYYAAELFDEIIITHDKNTRGNTNENITTALKQGIAHSQFKPWVVVISDEYRAVNEALARAKEDTFIFYTPENVLEAIEFIKSQQKDTITSLKRE